MFSWSIASYDTDVAWICGSAAFGVNHFRVSVSYRFPLMWFLNRSSQNGLLRIVCLFVWNFGDVNYTRLIADSWWKSNKLCALWFYSHCNRSMPAYGCFDLNLVSLTPEACQKMPDHLSPPLWLEIIGPNSLTSYDNYQFYTLVIMWMCL